MVIERLKACKSDYTGIEEKKMQTATISKKNRSFAIVLPKLFLILAVVFSMWIVLVLSGQMFLDYGSTWTGLPLSFWLMLISILFAAFIAIDILIYANPKFLASFDMHLDESSQTSPFEIKNGKRIYEFTIPKDVKGGLFSKTYIPIDEETVVRIRHQIVPDKKLWNKEEKGQ